MIVAHRDKSAVLQFRMGTRKIVDTDGGTFPVIKRSETITFKTMTPGIPTTKISTSYDSDGRAQSFIDTNVQAELLDVEESKLIDWLKQHPSWNNTMFAVNEETTDVVGNSEGHGDGITANGDGSFTCVACDNKYLKDARGVPNHLTSKAHVAALDALRGAPEAMSA